MQDYTQNHLLNCLTRACAPDDVFATDAGRVWTYGEILALAAQIGGVLLAQGVQPGDRVAAQVEKSLPVLALYLGCVQVGAVYLPLNMGYTKGELGFFITDAAPAVIVTDPSRVGLMAELTPTIPVLTLDSAGQGSIRADAAPAPVTPRGAEDLAAILYTSGTTGQPKGAMLSHRALASNAAVLAETWQVTADDRLIHALPIFHTHGLFVATNTLMAAGGSLIWHPKFDPARILADMPRATMLMGVPTFYTRLLEAGNLDAARTMRLFISGSAPLLAQTHADFQAHTGQLILERYGMTECNMNTSNPYNGARRAGTVGVPLPGVEIRVMAEPGAVGAIHVKGPNLFSGYWQKPEKTAEDMTPDGYFITGDLGRWDEAGYLEIVGRSKDLIISGGFNIYPKEVEAVLDDLPGIVESAVIGLPHPDLGEAVVAVLAVGSGGFTGDLAELLGESLARFKHPRAVFMRDSLPRNAMGKVQKAQLRAEYARYFETKPNQA